MQSQRTARRSRGLRYSAFAVLASGFVGAVLGLAVGFSIGQRAPAFPDEPLPRVRAANPIQPAPPLRMAVQNHHPAKGVPGDDI